ncbi:hypothetical protein ACIQGZ_22370 [Streptomyces sp. NPDC092296]|uniref:hypothetical protein n=1 Tax=Streptomyces sp. NPDC092296 TaxID=3366012 RepID=UPI0037F7DD5B
MPSALSITGDLSDLQHAVDRANDAVRAYVTEVELERRRCAGTATRSPQAWTDLQSATLARLQSAYLVAYQAYRAAARDLEPAA